MVIHLFSFPCNVLLDLMNDVSLIFSFNSFEKRFFRTFEDAMSPPPSFRRDNIATKKPDLQPKGWKNCSLDKKKFEGMYKLICIQYYEYSLKLM